MLLLALHIGSRVWDLVESDLLLLLLIDIVMEPGDQCVVVDQGLPLFFVDAVRVWETLAKSRDVSVQTVVRHLFMLRLVKSLQIDVLLLHHWRSSTVE